MSTRSSRRGAARVAAKIAVSSAEEKEVDAIVHLQHNLDVAKNYVRGYKAKLERVHVGLTAIRIALLKNDLPAANHFMKALFESDLAEAKKLVEDRDFALGIVVGALQRHATKDASDALTQAKVLVPYVFAEDTAPVGEPDAASAIASQAAGSA